MSRAKARPSRICPVCGQDFGPVVMPDVDPLDVTDRDGYATPPTKPILLRERPVIDDRGMVVVWIIAALAFLLAMGATVLLVAGRPPNG